MPTLFPMPSYSRREALRVDTPEGVRVYWSCAGRSDVSRIRNLSFGGILIETHTPQSVGAEAEIAFLVEEGQIRTKAVVRHVDGATGMGLQFRKRRKNSSTARVSNFCSLLWAESRQRN